MAGKEVISSAYIDIKFDKIDQEIAKLKGSVDKSARDTEATYKKAIAGIASAVGTIGLAKFGSDAIGAATKMDNLNRMLINVEGSADKANKRFEEFKVLAKAPILDPFNLSKFYVQLKSVNVEGQTNISFMKSLANAMAGAGGTNEAFAGFMEQMTQAVGKGKLLGDDLRLMASWFPQMRKYLTEAFDTSMPDEIAKKGYTAIDVMEKLNAVMEKAPKFSGGAQAAQDNFRQSLELFQASLAKTVLPEITKFLEKTTSLMDSFDEFPDKTKSAIGEFAMGGVGILGLAFAAKTFGIELSGVAAVITKNPLLAAALLGAVGGASISKYVPIPGLDEKKGIEAIPRTKEQQAYNRLGMAGYELDAIKAVKAGIGQNLSLALRPKTTEEWLAWQKENDLKMGLGFLGEPKSMSFYGEGYGRKTEADFGRVVGPAERYRNFVNPMALMGNRMAGYLRYSGKHITSISMYQQDMYNEPGRYINESTGLTQAEQTAINDQEKIKKAIQETAEEEEQLRKKGSEYWHDWGKSLDSTGTKMEKVKNEWDKLASSLEENRLEQGAYNFKKAWTTALDEAKSSAESFFNTLYQKSQEGVTEHTGTVGGVNSGFFDWVAKALDWVTLTAAKGVVSSYTGGIAMAEGGIVTKPTLAMIGEAGPEAVIPLGGKSSTNIGGDTTINVSIVIPNIDINTISQSQVEKLTRDKIIPALRNAARGGNGQTAIYG